MKIIILSDIEGKEETIIPYGLRLGTNTETAVDIFHNIDPRDQQGTSSSFADSSSVSPGGKLSHEKVLEREKNKAYMALQNYISGEGSRLNYPLKINLEIASGTLETNVRKLVEDNPGSVVVATMKPGNSMIGQRSEMLELARKLETLFFLIPPGHSFRKPSKVLLMTDFKQTSYQSMKQIINWLKPFNPLLHAFGITDPKQHTSMELESAAWKKSIQSFIESPMVLRTGILDKENGKAPLVKFVHRNTPDMVFLPRFIMGSETLGFSSDSGFGKMLGELERPAVIY